MSPRTQTQPITDAKMWRQLKARTHPDLGGSEDLFVWTGALQEAVQAGLGCEHGCRREAAARAEGRQTGRAEGRAESEAERTARRERKQQRSTTDRVPFNPDLSFEELTGRALRMAGEVEAPYAALLRLLEDCESSPLHATEQQRGASYRSLAAAGHRAEMTKLMRTRWYRIAESVPLSQRHVGHIISRLGEDG